jgi:hypothetical protein
VAGALLGTATLVLWEAFNRASVGAVRSLALLQVPIVILLAPTLTRGHAEEVTRSVLVGAALVEGGAALLLLSG